MLIRWVSQWPQSFVEKLDLVTDDEAVAILPQISEISPCPE
jgi:hypothetical protein